MIASLMKYLGCSYYELMYVIPWQVIQGIIATIPPYDNNSTKEGNNNSNKPVDFFAFGSKMSNLAL